MRDVKKPEYNIKIGLALGGGAARGWAHIGVIDAFNEACIPFCAVSGTSIGSVVGALFAAGLIEDAKKTILNIRTMDVIGNLDPVFSRGGLIGGKKIIGLFQNWFGEKEIEDLKIPFTAVAVNILNGKEVQLNKGSITSALRASISLPFIFYPAKVEDNLLVDGCLVNPVPVQIVRNLGADIVVAVDLNRYFVDSHQKSDITDPYEDTNGDGEENFLKKIENTIHTTIERLNKNQSPDMYEILLRTFMIMANKITEQRFALEKPDYIITPKVGEYTGTEFHKAEEIIALGYEAALPVIAEIRKNHLNIRRFIKFRKFIGEMIKSGKNRTIK